MDTTFTIAELWERVRNSDVSAIEHYLAHPNQCSDISSTASNPIWANHLTSLVSHAVRAQQVDVLDVLLSHTPTTILLDSPLRLAIQRGHDDIALRLIDHAPEFWCSDVTFGDCLATNNDTILRHMMARGLDPLHADYIQQLSQALEANHVECVRAVVEQCPDSKDVLLRAARWKEHLTIDMLDVIYDFGIVQEMMDSWTSKISNPDIHFAQPTIMAFHEREILRLASDSARPNIENRARKM